MVEEGRGGEREGDEAARSTYVWGLRDQVGYFEKFADALKEPAVSGRVG